jgi:hypothetical protein
MNTGVCEREGWGYSQGFLYALLSLWFTLPAVLPVLRWLQSAEGCIRFCHVGSGCK